MPFTHLHLHTEYSLLDGSAKIKETVAKIRELGMDSAAITDHGVMFGVIDFYKEAVKNGIKPILGCEIYVASGSRLNKENSRDNYYYHLVLLAENMIGYQNLIKLVSVGFTEGFYYKPRVDRETLREYSGGLIALSACMSGVVSRDYTRFGYDRALEQALFYDGLFGRGNFFLELQDHGLAEQKPLNQALMAISGETGIPLVCTNDCHYIGKDDAKAHEILLCIQTGKTIHDSDRMIYEGSEFYIKSPDEMAALFSHVPQALANTAEIAKRCNLEIKFNQYKLPKFRLPTGEANSADYLRKLCLDGLKTRYGDDAPGHMKRLEYELGVINGMGFTDYFLVTWDFIKYARDHGIMVGPGRGSGAGSIVAYCLTITNIDPISYNLIFERFLNPERVSMPDFDVDFCYERRQEVIDYVNMKYGADHVAQIVTFGTMGAKAVVRDVGRALGMPYADPDRIAKMIPFQLHMTIARALDLNPELKKAYDEEEDTRELIDMAMRLEGLPRHTSTHAAGVVICDKPVTEYVPLNVNDGLVTTQFPMTTVEELGLLKVDFLGLRTLTVIQNAVFEIKRNRGVSINIDNIPYDDPAVYEMISQARTEGVFQLESSGMKSFMRDLQPSCMEDIIAGISLYRPGPMEFIPKYVRGKNGAGALEYTHPALEPILKDTYGCIVYQEQVMQIVRDLAGYSMARSDLVRRAMSKKKADVMAQERLNFIHGCEGVPGCIANGIPQSYAEKIFDEMASFASYAFNKSHAAAYAVVGYQTAWLKHYYPVEFMAAIMTSVIDFTAKVAEYIDECRKLGIGLLPPDVNEGFASFSVSGENIRFGLLAIKNVGRGVIDAIVAEREANGRFKSLGDFITRLGGGGQGKDLNKRCLESFIKAGAFDSLGGRRVQYMTAYKAIADGVSSAKKRNIEGQISLFEIDGGEDDAGDRLPDIEEYSLRDILNYEKEVLGVYLSGHPLSEYMPVIESKLDRGSADFMSDEESGQCAVADGMAVNYGGMISAKSVKYTKTANKPMAFLTVEDMYGSVEVIVFTQLYEKYLGRLTEEKVIVVNGRVSVKEDEDAKIIANEIFFYEDMLEEHRRRRQPAKTLWIKIPAERPVEFAGITDILETFAGDVPVVIYDEAKKTKFRASESFWVEPAEALTERLHAVLGEGSVKLVESG
ncbi:MAG: DNA polymerase III subunit alpha [Firmicutes bacterium]|nr:DNA polymerase III subunit alpha [Bacillota bacterium]